MIFEWLGLSEEWFEGEGKGLLEAWELLPLQVNRTAGKGAEAMIATEVLRREERSSGRHFWGWEQANS
ncbi:MAG: hypothetical protein IBX69_10625 [Anaerolineales bacterium]|nr:hypothetical protein [Anaerolineales bacterium]